MNGRTTAILLALTTAAILMQRPAVAEPSHCQLVHMTNCVCVERAMAESMGTQRAEFLVDYWLHEADPSGPARMNYLLTNRLKISEALMAFAHVKQSLANRCDAAGQMFDNVSDFEWPIE
jgi:hypothetical protein